MPQIPEYFDFSLTDSKSTMLEELNVNVGLITSRHEDISPIYCSILNAVLLTQVNIKFIRLDLFFGKNSKM